jgi:hypothetical protein
MHALSGDKNARSLIRWKFFEPDIFHHLYNIIISKNLTNGIQIQINTYIHKLFVDVYKFYVKNINQIKEYNTLIFKYISSNYIDIIINFNFKTIENDIICYFLQTQVLKLNGTSVKMDNIIIKLITKILKSYYDTIYFKMKNELMN